MKNYSKICRVMLSGAALTAMFSACTFEQENFFDESAALRIRHMNEDVKSTLCAPTSENGWLIQYFVGGTEEADFEGFNLFGKFYETGKVTLSGDHRYLRNGNAGKYTEYTSYYEMLAEEGPVLAFNTWNDVLTVFVDPVSPSSAPSSLVPDGEGMHGDDRLVVLSYNSDEILLRGERHTAPVRFLKLDCTPEEYLAKVEELKNTVATEKMTEYSISNANETRYISGLNKGYFNLLDRLDDPLEKEVKSCVFTPNGFRTEHSFVIGGDTVQDFTLNDAKDRMVCGNVEIAPCWQRAVNKLVGISGRAQITTEGACESFAALYDKLASDIKSVFTTQTFNYITFGKSSESGSKSRVGLVFYVSTTRSKYLTGFAGTITVDEAAGTATINVDVNDPSDNYNNYNKKGIGSSFTDIVNAMNGTYNLKPDNIFNPATVVWTKTDDSSFYFTTKF